MSIPMRRTWMLIATMTAAAASGCGSDLLGMLGRPAPTVTFQKFQSNALAIRALVDTAAYPEAVSLNWSFGDGSQATRLPIASGRGVSHVYGRAGTFKLEAFLFTAAGKLAAKGETSVTVRRDSDGGGGGDTDTNGTDDDSDTNGTDDDSNTNGTNDPDGPTRVRLQTTMGDIVLEMRTQQAPITVANYLQYVDSGHFNGVVFHRVIDDFVIQGGAFESRGAGADPRLVERGAGATIVSEASNGFSNIRGTVAMALRGQNANSATDQFFINVADNTNLDTGPPPFTVFAVVVEGMAVADAISLVPRGMVNAQNADGSIVPFDDVPDTDVVILSATRE